MYKNRSGLPIANNLNNLKCYSLVTYSTIKPLYNSSFLTYALASSAYAYEFPGASG